MKITINVECTPEEARRYMGLPDVAPMQEAMLKEMQSQMLANTRSMQPSEMMQAWLPMGLNGWLDMQKEFWTQMTAVASEKNDDPNAKK
ncbi:MAG: hypothetical protein KDA99_02080 [Planctomycetales bacterium]|nr:hypothetical protein [Planctomycetales bacterium]